MRTVEAIVCWSNGTWNSRLFKVPEDVPEEEIEEYVRHIVLTKMKSAVGSCVLFVDAPAAE